MSKRIGGFSIKELDLETMKKLSNATIEDVVGKIKELPVYDSYVASVKDGEEDSNMTLQAMTMLFATMLDSELSFMVHSVATDLLFAMIDQKLRHEILEGETNGKSDEE